MSGKCEDASAWGDILLAAERAQAQSTQHPADIARRLRVMSIRRLRISKFLLMNDDVGVREQVRIGCRIPMDVRQHDGVDFAWIDLQSFQPALQDGSEG